MSKYLVEFFERPNGEVPAEIFIDSLDSKMAAKFYRLLVMVAENGPALREPYSKHLGDGIFELRVQSAGNIGRVLYFFMVGSRVVVTNGFIKTTQRTPKSEIDKAKAYRQEYILRRKSNEDT